MPIAALPGEREMARFAGVFVALIAPAVTCAIEVPATLKSVDVESARITFGAPDGRERTAKVAPDAKLVDAAGNELTAGLKSEQLKAGARAMLTVVPEGNQPLI